MDKAIFLPLMEEAERTASPLAISLADGTEMIVSVRDITRVDDSGITVANDLEGEDGRSELADYDDIPFADIVGVMIYAV